MRRLVWFLLFAVMACGPSANHRGEAGYHCRPDGTCLGKLVCVDSPVYLGIPIDAKPSCQVRH